MKKTTRVPTSKSPKYVLVDELGRFYHFWDKQNYGEPQFGDYYNAKKMISQGCASAMRMLLAAGYVVVRQPVPQP